MLTGKQRKKCIERLESCAVQKYGTLKTRKIRPVLDQLILSIFYRLTSVRRATRAFRELKRSFVDWNELRISSIEEIVDHLSSAGWAWVGAVRIREMVEKLFAVRNEVSLEFLRDEMTPAQVRRFLREVLGVDRGLANEVLMLSLQVPIFPCSEEIARVCHRLGLLQTEQSNARNQRILTESFDPEWYPVVHRFLFDIAGRWCLPEQPRCKECLMQKHCASAQKKPRGVSHEKT